MALSGSVNFVKRAEFVKDFSAASSKHRKKDFMVIAWQIAKYDRKIVVKCKIAIEILPHTFLFLFANELLMAVGIFILIFIAYCTHYANTRAKDHKNIAD